MNSSGQVFWSFQFALHKSFVDDYLRGDISEFTSLPCLYLLAHGLDQSEKVEISITEADDLFREVRIVNMLKGADGELVGLKQGARVDVTFEAEINDTFAKSKDSEA